MDKRSTLVSCLLALLSIVTFGAGLAAAFGVEPHLQRATVWILVPLAVTLFGIQLQSPAPILKGMSLFDIAFFLLTGVGVGLLLGRGLLGGQ